jgi:hypothetical protein
MRNYLFNFFSFSLFLLIFPLTAKLTRLFFTCLFICILVLETPQYNRVLYFLNNQGLRFKIENFGDAVEFLFSLTWGSFFIYICFNFFGV